MSPRQWLLRLRRRSGGDQDCGGVTLERLRRLGWRTGALQSETPALCFGCRGNFFRAGRPLHWTMGIASRTSAECRAPRAVRRAKRSGWRRGGFVGQFQCDPSGFGRDGYSAFMSILIIALRCWRQGAFAEDLHACSASSRSARHHDHGVHSLDDSGFRQPVWSFSSI